MQANKPYWAEIHNLCLKDAQDGYLLILKEGILEKTRLWTKESENEATHYIWGLLT